MTDAKKELRDLTSELRRILEDSLKVLRPQK
jgi:hypothetical protein